MSDPRVEPPDVIQAVEGYIAAELSEAAQYENREPFDESGVWSLHRLAAKVYLMGWADGERAESQRQNQDRYRRRPGA